jgi:heme exporter protein CcmD
MMDMGKNALFIWASYGVTISALILLTLASLRRMRALEANADAMKRDRRA